MPHPLPRLVICHKQLGDITLLEPALAKLASASGGGVELLTRGGHAPLLSLMTGVKPAKRVWFRRFEALTCYDDLDKSALHTMLVISDKKDLLLRSPSEITRLARIAFDEIRTPGLGAHYLAKYNWDFTPVDSPMRFRPPALSAPPGAWRPSSAPREKYILLNSTAGWKSKRWKSSAWARVAKRLARATGKKILLTSGSQDWQVEHSKKIAEALGDVAVYVGGRTTLEEYLWLAANASLVIGVDGSASHLAAAFGVPNVTLFFRTNPLNWHFPTATSVAICAVENAETGEYEVDENAVYEAASALDESAASVGHDGSDRPQAL